MQRNQPKEKESRARTFRIRKDIGEKLDAYSDFSMINRTKIVECALEEYINNHMGSSIINK